jgi:hypothetical protein
VICSHVKLAGLNAIVCGSGARIRSCVKCAEPAERLCDWKTGRDRTCDLPMCARCTSSPAPGKDLCPKHAAAWAAHPANAQLALTLPLPRSLL